MHDAAPTTSTRSNDDIEETTRGKTQQQKGTSILAKRCEMWRSIVLSSMNRTLFPYSKYIRTLRLQDLEDLLEIIGDPKAGKFHKLVLVGLHSPRSDIQQNILRKRVGAVPSQEESESPEKGSPNPR